MCQKVAMQRFDTSSFLHMITSEFKNVFYLPSATLFDISY